MSIKFGSVCSGIEAASVAWEKLGWECSFVSEIDNFPSAVLKHRYPDVPNFGDFTTITYEKVKTEGKYPTIDVLIGGTPCQSFSVAGLRKGLGSENGNLALEFVRLLSRIRPRWFIWENVPGVFSSSGGSDFASILAGFTGRVVGVPAEGWRNSGAIEGIAEAYDVSWRILDAQYFGVAQRRRRVFVIGHLVECAGRICGEEFQEHGGIPNLAAAVLFESDCLQGNPEPRREKREGTSSSTKGGVDASGDVSCTGGNISPTVTSKWEKGYDKFNNPVGIIGSDDNFGPLPIHDQATRHNGKRGDNQDGKGNGLGIGEESDPMFTLTKGDKHAVFQDSTLSFNSRQIGMAVGEDIASSILSTDYKDPQIVTYGFLPKQGADAGSIGMEEEKSPTLRAGCDTYGIYQTPVEPIAVDTYNQTINEHTTQSLSSAETDVNHYEAVLEPKVFDWQSGGDARGLDLKDTAQLQRCQTPALLQTMAIRRLTPIECERLQGFPENWTRIPYRGKQEDSCPDGPRYKACGNSMAVPVMAWIGKRIQLVTDMMP